MSFTINLKTGKSITTKFIDEVVDAIEQGIVDDIKFDGESYSEDDFIDTVIKF